MYFYPVFLSPKCQHWETVIFFHCIICISWAHRTVSDRGSAWQIFIEQTWGTLFHTNWGEKQVSKSRQDHIPTPRPQSSLVLMTHANLDSQIAWFKSESRSVVSDSLWPHGLYSPWISPGQNTGVGSLSLLQGIFPTQGSNPGLPHCRRILYQLSHQGSLRRLEWVAYPFSSRSSRPRDRTGVSCIAGRFFTSWAKLGLRLHERDFPGGVMAQTPCSPCRGCGFNPRSGN